MCSGSRDRTVRVWRLIPTSSLLGDGSSVWHGGGGGPDTPSLGDAASLLGDSASASSGLSTALGGGVSHSPASNRPLPLSGKTEVILASHTASLYAVITLKDGRLVTWVTCVFLIGILFVVISRCRAGDSVIRMWRMGPEWSPGWRSGARPGEYPAMHSGYGGGPLDGGYGYSSDGHYQQRGIGGGQFDDRMSTSTYGGGPGYGGRGPGSVGSAGDQYNNGQRLSTKQRMLRGKFFELLVHPTLFDVTHVLVNVICRPSTRPSFPWRQRLVWPIFGRRRSERTAAWVAEPAPSASAGAVRRRRRAAATATATGARAGILSCHPGASAAAPGYQYDAEAILRLSVPELRLRLF
jgi:hypothetical protein